MMMTGIGAYPGIQTSYYGREIKTVSPEQVREQEALKTKESAASDVLSSVQTPEADKARAQRVASLQDISLSFERPGSRDAIGSESSLEKLDEERAFSSGKKDSILQNYNYFVGSGKTPMKVDQSLGGLLQSISADGLVFLK